jgi:hypothetical protein
VRELFSLFFSFCFQGIFFLKLYILLYMKVEKVYLMRNTGRFWMDLQARSSWREQKRKEEK